MSAPLADLGGADTSRQSDHLTQDGRQAVAEPFHSKTEPEGVKLEYSENPGHTAREQPGPFEAQHAQDPAAPQANGVIKEESPQHPAAPSSLDVSYSQPVEEQPSTSHSQLEGGLEEEGEGGKQVSTGDIQRVQNYIEKCLQMYLSQKEVISQLQQQFKIEPCFTQLVWQKLEEQNQEFFRAYYTRLKLKDQIILFNHLLDEQVKMFQRMPRGGQMLPGIDQACQAYYHPLTAGPWTAQSRMPRHPGMAAPQARPGAPQGFPHPIAQPSGVLPSQQQPGMPGQPPPVGSSYPPGPDAASQPAQLNADPGQLNMGDFPGIDLPSDLATIGQSLPFSGSEINLAGLVPFGSPGRGPLGGGVDHVDLSGLPRNFSLSDLALDQVNEGDHGLPRNISLSDLPTLDLDSGGEQG